MNYDHRRLVALTISVLIFILFRKHLFLVYHVVFTFHLPIMTALDVLTMVDIHTISYIYKRSSVKIVIDNVSQMKIFLYFFHLKRSCNAKTVSLFTDVQNSAFLHSL